MNPQAYYVMTERGLTAQVLVDDGDEVIDRVENPISSVDPRMTQILSERETGICGIGFDNTISLIPQSLPMATLGHLLLADTLADMKEVRQAESLVDLGCGCGLIGNYAAKNFEGLKEGKVVFADLSQEALDLSWRGYKGNNEIENYEVIVQTSDDVTRMRIRDRQEIELRPGNVLDTMNGMHADIALAAPFYIPAIAPSFPQAFCIFALSARKMGADFYVVHSSLADNQVVDAARETNGKLDEVVSREYPLLISDLPLEIENHLTTLGLRVRRVGDNVIYQHDLKVSRMSYK